MNFAERVETDSIDYGATSHTSLMILSHQLERKRKNKVACGIVSLVCIAGITVGFGFLFIQQSEFVQEKLHFSEAESVPQMEPVAQAQRQNDVIFDLPNENSVPRAATTTVSSSTTHIIPTNSTENGSQVVVPASTDSRSRNTTKALPANAQSKHPVSLLYEMKVEPAFLEFVCPRPGRQHFFKCVLQINLNGSLTEFLGYGLKKKIAKRHAAQEACTRLYNLTYTENQNPDLLQDMVDSVECTRI